VSDWVKINLDELLHSRSIVVNREVQIHIRERSDIHVDAFTCATREAEPRRIKLIVEVKGCWNPDQKRAMRRQLVDRYLAQNDCTHGILLLAWFVCQHWTNSDHRRRTVPFATKQAAVSYFAEQASGLSKAPLSIRSVILDATVSSTRHANRAKSSRLCLVRRPR
jgi:hypothetical protein